MGSLDTVSRTVNHKAGIHHIINRARATKDGIRITRVALVATSSSIHNSSRMTLMRLPLQARLVNMTDTVQVVTTSSTASWAGNKASSLMTSSKALRRLPSLLNTRRRSTAATSNSRSSNPSRKQVHNRSRRAPVLEAILAMASILADTHKARASSARSSIGISKWREQRGQKGAYRCKPKTFSLFSHAKYFFLLFFDLSSFVVCNIVH